MHHHGTAIVRKPNRRFRKATEAEAAAAFAELNSPLPADFTMYEIGDPIDVLPSEATKARLLSLRQRAIDSRSIWLPISDDIREVRAEKYKADARLAQLKLPRGSGGPNLDEDDKQVIDVRKRIAHLESEIARLTALEQQRAATMHATGTVQRNVEDWLRRGRPPGTVLVEAPLIEPGEVLKKGERLPDAVERLRHRLRELVADAHRIRSAPFPADDCRRKMREEVAAIAARGTPSVDGLVENFGAIAWPQTMQVLPLVAMGTDGSPIIGRAQGEVDAALAFTIFLHKEAVIKSLDAMISEADDGQGLSARDRELKLAEIGRDRLMIERQEAALVWHALETGDSAEHRPDASPRSVLGVELRTAA
jgi:hypothetical protein